MTSVLLSMICLHLALVLFIEHVFRSGFRNACSFSVFIVWAVYCIYSDYQFSLIVVYDYYVLMHVCLVSLSLYLCYFHKDLFWSYVSAYFPWFIWVPSNFCLVVSAILVHYICFIQNMPLLNTEAEIWIHSLNKLFLREFIFICLRHPDTCQQKRDCPITHR